MRKRKRRRTGEKGKQRRKSRTRGTERQSVRGRRKAVVMLSRANGRQFVNRAAARLADRLQSFSALRLPQTSLSFLAAGVRHSPALFDYVTE